MDYRRGQEEGRYCSGSIRVYKKKAAQETETET
jgi:hypothetical protein